MTRLGWLSQTAAFTISLCTFSLHASPLPLDRSVDLSQDIRLGQSRQLPLINGFPSPSPTQLKEIEAVAQGTLPNGPLLTQLTFDSLTSLRLIAFNEMFEVAFFSSLLYNITHDVAGYTASELAGENRNYLIASLQSILAQEELHAIGANDLLKANRQWPIVPCESYTFPVTNFTAAIELANVFTTLNAGVLQDITSLAAANGDAFLARSRAAVLSEEGAQKGYFRRVLGRTPSEQPFLTTAVREFAFTALQGYITPGTKCANVSDIGLQTLNSLTVEVPPKAKGGDDSTVQFSIAIEAATTTITGDDVTYDADDIVQRALYVTYLNGFNSPLTVSPATATQETKDRVYFTADFPYAAYELNGLTLASVSFEKGPWKDPDEMVKKAIWGPGIIYLFPEGK